MTDEELTEEQKQKIANSLSEMEKQLDAVRSECTSEEQKKIIKLFDDFLDQHRA